MDSGEHIAVAPDSSVRLTEANPQKWVDSMNAHWYWGSPSRKQATRAMPTIAIVDSGIDASRVDNFDRRVLTQVDLTSGTGPNSPGDGRGHGTMVASLASGSNDKRTGVNPDARLVSLDVIDDNGTGRTSDVIASIDWILQNRNAYNIRVANFSLQSVAESSFMFDPLSIAVERLWLNGIVVVAAAGNYANGGAVSGVLYAPASDPFVITVGAVDIGKDGNVRNDVAAPWSAWGYTRDGFLKPEISAPGRYMIGAIPAGSTLAAAGGQDPKLVKQGYIELSGTSFAAPVVSGAAAVLLAVHPDWTPDQVKGALMVSVSPLPAAVFGSVGMGEINLKDALSVTAPPNPNAALNAYLVSTPAGPVFDAARWSSGARTNASWSSASWSSASWSSASWSSASWSSASWSSASWASASWSSAAWTSASWSSASWSSASWSSAATVNSLALADNAAADGLGDG
jgi:serine protease AprX